MASWYPGPGNAPWARPPKKARALGLGASSPFRGPPPAAGRLPGYPTRMQEEVAVDCPHCGETFTILVDPSVPEQDTIEDCFVCCRPIRFQIVCAGGAVESVEALRD